MAGLRCCVCALAAVAGALDAFVPLSWEDARASARAMLQRMTDEEKTTLMNGIGFDYVVQRAWWYVGNTAPIPRLGIPSFNLQDAAAGFRVQQPSQDGTATCWPSLLALSATWNESLVLEFGRALAREFIGKGANAVLGPSVNVHRVARNGRNFEYLSGEDPFLGARLTRKYVEGVQSRRGIFTVTKHFAMNEQETHRMSESSNVDDKTKWELYYPPFQAAVDAGTGGIMCSYNKVSGVDSCSNKQLLVDDLKGTMNFQGFVVSDWWATHATAVADGLDEDMPGSMEGWYASDNLLCHAGSTYWRFKFSLLAAIVIVIAATMALAGMMFAKARRSKREETLLEETFLDRSSGSSAEDSSAGNGSELGPPQWCPPHSATPTMLFAEMSGVIAIAVIYAALWYGWYGGALELHTCTAPTAAALDESVTRLLSAMYRYDLFSTTRCSAPCKDLLLTNVTSDEHAELARAIAASSIVLLKNAGDVLPLEAPGVKSIAVVGTAAFAQARDTPPVAMDVLLGAVAGLAGIALICTGFWCTWLVSKSRPVKYAALCGALAAIVAVLPLLAGVPDLVAGDFGQGDFYTGGGSGRVQPLWVSRPIDGIRIRAEAAGMTVLEANTEDFALAEEAVRRADVTIVVGGTTSGESWDRESLRLDGGVDGLIAEVAKVARKTVVLAQVPGAVVLPWSSAVDAVAMMFLGGQATGMAWADVLFGDRAPTGRLPISLPLRDQDQIMPESGLEVPYSEGLKTGYRSQFSFAFPFGHGLTYTEFSYGVPASYRCQVQPCPSECGSAAFCLTSVVSNTGRRDGEAVAQLYLEFPPDAGEPAAILKGFYGTGTLPPGGSALAIFPLSKRDVSYYADGAWVLADAGTVHVGDSAANFLQTLSLSFS